jgi:hypothetical protein
MSLGQRVTPRLVVAAEELESTPLALDQTIGMLLPLAAEREKIFMGLRRFHAVVVAVLVSTAFIAGPGVVDAKQPDGKGKTPTNEYEPDDAVLMICADDQTDINRASVDELAAAFGLDVPVAERLVESRPYLQPYDLTVVNGIGPGTRDAIVASGNACATLMSEPPPADDVCDGPELVDLQLAGIGELRQRLGISKPAAVAIVDARPYSIHAHVTPERVPGLGKGNYEELASRTCLTPATVDTGTTRWEWAYSSDAKTVTRGEFSLTVPAGVIDDVGAFVSIEEIAASPIPFQGPAADYHIWGNWADGTDTVTVTQPVNAALQQYFGDGLTDVLAHVPPDPTELSAIEFSTPSNTTVAEGKVSAATTDLSSFVSTAVNVAFFGAGPVGRTALYLGINEFVAHQVEKFLGQIASPPSCPRGSPLRVETVGDAVTEEALLHPARPPLLFCVDTADDGDALWRFRNNSGSVLSVDASPTAHVKIVDVGGPTPALGGTGNFLIDSTYDVWNLTGSHDENTIKRSKAEVPPGAEVVLRAPEGTADEVVRFEVASFFNVTAVAMRSVGLMLPESMQLGYAAFDCGLNVINVLTDETAMAQCFINLSDAALRLAVGVVLSVADAVVTFESTLRGEFGGPWQVRLSHIGPPPPPGSNQPGSGTVPAPGTSPSVDGRLILKVSSGPESWLLDADGVAHPIGDGGLYECLADRYPVRYHIEPGAEFNSYATGGIGSPATCPFDVDVVTFGPDAQYGIRNVIIRQDNGEAWVVDSAGYRSPILTGEAFNCLADLYYVWDLLTAEEVRRFPRDPSIVARFCTSG